MSNERSSSRFLFVDAPVRVRYAETDRMGIAYHANHVIWFEVGRTELCRAAGLVYRELEDRHRVLLVVAEIGVRYAAAALYDDELVVRTRVGELASRSVRFDYEVLRPSDGARIATGFSRHIFCDGETRRPTRAPDEARQVFERYLAD